tara:strand:- start:142 stop:357 length:216 start_codon:yes stop_codon:yes gene_type:complete
MNKKSNKVPTYKSMLISIAKLNADIESGRISLTEASERNKVFRNYVKFTAGKTNYDYLKERYNIAKNKAYK